MVQTPSDLTPAKEVCREGNVIICMGRLMSMPLEKKRGVLSILTLKNL